MELPQPVRIGLLCCAAMIAGTSSGSIGAGNGADDLESAGRGRSLFEQRWYVAPSALGPWGRGPTSNADACADCHADYGRGAPPEAPDEPMIAMVLRLSVGEPSGGMAPQPHPSYGLQLQTQGTLGTVPTEGSATIDWIPESVTLEDGTVVAMRRPRIRMQVLAFGELGPDTSMSARIPPPLRGLGLLESIPDATLEALAARDAGDGIRGRINRLHGGSAIGRFGHKANVPSLREQVATALHEDLGLTSTMFPTQNCPSTQSACARQPNPPGPEIRDDQIDDLVTLLRSLSVPPRQATNDAQTRRGETLFVDLNCSGCHVPRISPESPGAYTDLLLHDLGAGLADGRPEFAAGPRDWRTAPLWGSGAAASGARFLHDGRARTLEEAILWHGGEAEAARNRYARLPQPDRAALTRFLFTL